MALPAQQMHQRLISAIDRGLMPRPDGTHYEDLAPDELETFDGRQNTDFGPSHVLIHEKRRLLIFDISSPPQYRTERSGLRSLFRLITLA
jgi:hypothetical protein